MSLILLQPNSACKDQWIELVDEFYVITNAALGISVSFDWIFILTT